MLSLSFTRKLEGNIDFQLIIDIEKVLHYITKYVIKTESNMSKSVASMICNILKKIVESRLSVQVVLKRVIAKLLGEHMMSKQETSHLILLLPVVSYSHQFFRVNLDVESTEINISPVKNNG